MTEEVLNGSTLLDIGCNIGGMIFASQLFNPSYSLGVEIDDDKVTVATKIAAYNGLNNIEFKSANADEATTDTLKGPYDVVFCFALVAHVMKKDLLYRLLGDVTKKTLFFEGNATTDRDEIETKLREAGFEEVTFLGLCDDDIVPSNNNRPMYIARK